MLLDSHRPSEEDMRVWRRLEAVDRRLAQSARLRRLIDQAERDALDFIARGGVYASVSWGKDSVAMASIVARVSPETPLVHVRWVPTENPDSLRVRDAFLARHDVTYHEVISSWHRLADGTWAPDSPSDKLEATWRRASQVGGPRRITGIRGNESASRALRLRVHGISSELTCAPLSRWSGVDVFALLALRDLPIHPAYACGMEGALERERIRVDALLGETGTAYGRREWERRYYRDELLALGEQEHVTT